MDAQFGILLIATLIGGAVVVSLLWVIVTCMIYAVMSWNGFMQRKLRRLAIRNRSAY